MPLREQLEAAVNTVEETKAKQSEAVPGAPSAPAPAPAAPSGEAAPTPASAPEGEKPGRTAGRPRDEKGRLLPGKPERPAETPPASPAPAAAPAPEPAKPKVSPPSSWKKEFWGAWEKLAGENPTLADYLIQRESEFARGVSTYKQEYDAIKPVVEALQPLLPTLQQYNIAPAQWISAMGNAHYQLVFGSPHQKLQMFAKLAQDYGVPLQALYDASTQQQFLMQQALTPAQPSAPQPDVRAIVQEQLTEITAKQELEGFQAAKDKDGNPAYPHYEAVRETMAQLLESGTAHDLKSAYDKAIRLNDDIWEAEQKAKQAAAQKAAQEAQARQVAQAKAAAVSTKSATPAVEPVQTTKGVRGAVEAAFDAHAAASGRV